jgi:hypothetical protein
MGLGGEDRLQVIVHLRVRDLTLSERVLQAPYGRLAVVLGDLRRHVLRTFVPPQRLQRIRSGRSPAKPLPGDR